ncbi:MAG TPA: 3-deoxy-7-phosphoheptulonate synthase [Planctomycetota bacterium]|nr:3-deoxy-7-phosphoheptulonate synthase [Planctomycetota bacterium]
MPPLFCSTPLILVLKEGVDRAARDRIVRRVEELGFRAAEVEGGTLPLVCVLGTDGRTDPSLFRALTGVERVIPLERPYPLVSRGARKEDTVVRVGGARIGGGSFVAIAGPCAVEDRETTFAVARAVRDAGAAILRGGAFKPRASPYSFRGLGEEGLRILADAASEFGLAVVTEVIDPRDLDRVLRCADLLQVGSRNMQNYALLAEVGRAGKPVLLKRGMAATLEDLLLSAEYLVEAGNRDVVLCERGVRGFDEATRNLLDLAAVPALKRLTHLPVIVDPSHATGRAELVPPMAKAAVCAGADGVMVEVHPSPERAKSDGRQALPPEAFAALMRELARLVPLEGKRLLEPSAVRA